MFEIIIKYWVYFYCCLYILCLPFLSFLFWFWITHVDRVHLRLKFNSIGKNIKNKMKIKLSQNNLLLIDKYICTQLNSIGEIIAGFTDGFLNKNSSIKINYTINTQTQTQINKSLCYDKNIQTNEIIKRDMYTITEEQKEINIIKKLFVTNNKKNTKIIDTEILEKDFEEANIKKKEKRIVLVKK